MPPAKRAAKKNTSKKPALTLEQRWALADQKEKSSLHQVKQQTGIQKKQKPALTLEERWELADQKEQAAPPVVKKPNAPKKPALTLEERWELADKKEQEMRRGV